MKLTDHNHDKYITSSEFNRVTKVFDARLVRTNLVIKTDFDVKLISLNKLIISNVRKHLLVEKKMKKLKTFDPSHFIGKSHFEKVSVQSYLVFQPIQRFFKRVSNIMITLNPGNLKDCLMKGLILLLHLTMVLLHNEIVMVLK